MNQPIYYRQATISHFPLPLLLSFQPSSSSYQKLKNQPKSQEEKIKSTREWCKPTMAKQSLFLLNLSSKDKTTTKRKSNNGRMISCNLKTDCWDAFEEPSSPRVSCVGQIKRDHDRLTQAKGGGAYHKSFFMKMLSCGTISHRRISADLFEEKEDEEEDFEVVDVLDMDPPLPVVKCGVSERGCVNLWKRRCGGSLEGLQVGQIEKPL